MKTQNLIIVIALFFSVTLSSCFRFDFDVANCIQGEGSIVERELTLAEISKVNLAGSFKVVVSQGLEQKVVAVGHENIIDHLKTNVSNQQWDVCLDNGCYNDFDLTVYITVPQIDHVKLSGSGKIELEDFDQPNDLNVTLTGSGDFSMNEFETSENLYATLQGSGCFYANKEVNCFSNLEVKCSGSGNFNGVLIKSVDCTATTSGSGKCYVSVENNLNATISGSGDIVYEGTPSIRIDDNGSGNLKQLN